MGREAKGKESSLRGRLFDVGEEEEEQGGSDSE